MIYRLLARAAAVVDSAEDTRYSVLVLVVVFLIYRLISLFL